MSNFYEIQYVKVFGTGEQVNIGKFAADQSFSLRYARTRLYRKGSFSNGEKVRLCISGNEDLSFQFAVSSWIKINEMLDYNFVNFQFSGENISQNCDYFAFFETIGYSRSADDKYLAAHFAHPDECYAMSNGPIGGAGIYFSLIGDTEK